MSKEVFEGKKFSDFKEDLDKVLEKYYPNTDYEWEYYDDNWNGVLSTDMDAKWRLVKVYLDLEEMNNE